MKVRAQRTHFMGASNRNPQNFDTKANTHSVFQRSFNKSKSLYSRDNHSQIVNMNSQVKDYDQSKIQNNNERVKPFLGMHHEFESRRFDKMNKKGYKPSKMILAPTQKILDLAHDLNKQVKSIQSEFINQNINMHKLRELKHTFVKNNRQRRNLKPYYAKFANQDGVIDENGIKKLVKQYGFDVNNQEIRLMCRLSSRNHKQSNSSQHKNELHINDFIQLMTREDVYYKTLKLGQGKDFTFGEKEKHFPDNVHEILRNKFPKLKQAFKIYRSRQEDIDYDKFEYVMKKLDLTNLVLPEQEKNKIFNDYSQQGVFNVEKLVCAIAEQQYGKKLKKPSAIDFTNNLHTDQEKNYKLQKKARANSLKNMSYLQYQNQLRKAQGVLNEFKQIMKEQKNKNEKQKISNIFENQITTRKNVAQKIQKVMKNNGINFQKEDYDAFLAYLDFDVRGQISQDRIYKNLFVQTQKEAQQRFQRRLRNEAPKKHGSKSEMISYSDQDTAIRCLQKIKNHKMNPQNRELFHYFDADNDGFISTNQLEQKLKGMNLIQNWEINALTSYLDSQNKGSIDFNQFNQKVNKEATPNQLPFVRTTNSKSCSEWNKSVTSTKRNFIKTMNQATYQRPSQFSAWPERLKHSDLSLIQPLSDSAMHISEFDRFRERKEDYGLRQKLILNKIKQNKIQKTANWNEKIQNQKQHIMEQEEDRQAARNYALRLAQEKYEEHCHKSAYS